MVKIKSKGILSICNCQLTNAVGQLPWKSTELGKFRIGFPLRWKLFYFFKYYVATHFEYRIFSVYGKHIETILLPKRVKLGLHIIYIRDKT